MLETYSHIVLDFKKKKIINGHCKNELNEKKVENKSNNSTP